MPAFGFGMRPRGPEHASQRPDLPHLVRRRDHHVEIEPVLLDLRDVLDADVVRTGGLRFARLLTGGDHEHAHRLARARWQHHGAADDLVGVPRIDAEAHRDLDRLVELRECGFA